MIKTVKNKQMIYEFITPSDAITFVADDEKLAIAVAIVLGKGKAGCSDENGNDLPTMYLFSKDPDKEISDKLGMPLKKFWEDNRENIITCLESFAYGNIRERKGYDDAIEAITDPVKLKEFKAKHEDRNRSSMNQWVKYAWDLAESLKKSENV